jgi:hypothetical protein
MLRFSQKRRPCLPSVSRDTSGNHAERNPAPSAEVLRPRVAELKTPRIGLRWWRDGAPLGVEGAVAGSGSGGALEGRSDSVVELSEY